MLSNFDKAMIIVAGEEEKAKAEAFYARLKAYNSPTYLDDLEKSLNRFVIKDPKQGA